MNGIKLVCTDVDGVLTDGGIYYTERGEELKKFNTRDGMGVDLLRKAGIPVAFITGEETGFTKARAKKLGVEDLYLGCKADDKAAALDKLAEKYGISVSQIAYIGDDVNDIEALKKAGFACAVADGRPEVKEAADYTTRAKGGEGAFREISDMILAREKEP